MRIRKAYRTRTWEEGKTLISNIAQEFGLSLDERDDTLVATDEDETVKISVFLDPRGFGFVKAVVPQEMAETIDRFIQERL